MVQRKYVPRLQILSKISSSSMHQLRHILPLYFVRSFLPFMQDSLKTFHIDPSVYPYFDLYPAPYFANNTSQGMTTTTRNTELSVVQFSLQYPIFNLCMCFKVSPICQANAQTFADPAVYPYFDIYPSLPSNPVALGETAVKTSAKFSSRLTHAELHAMVMMEKVGSTGSFGYMERGNLSDVKAVPRANFLSEASHGANLKSFGTPIRNIHGSSPSQAHRVSMAFKAGAYSMSQDQNNWSEGEQTTPEFNSSPISRSRSLRQERHDVPLPSHNSIVQGRDTVSRSNSLRGQIQVRSSSTGLPPRPAPRKRDSIVLQRIKAFDSTGEYDS